ncbi:Formyl transferase N-terminal [Penicillium chermesinum]|uniref:Formyl transferase N-terminal n=1 Tax=Penicillium chermesinum TaxID=63820 RepID=A0A9W9N9W2_9EURO|nr:Formyl transferase N-terminal [Penicillium chermesinum]KAJ5215138.1 Formyl transferase N-terminal [Penicillium chermesinum]
MASSFILTLSGPDRPGIVHAVTAFLVEHNLNIINSSHRPHRAPATRTAPRGLSVYRAFLLDGLRNSPTAKKPRVLIMVSKIGHCLNDLLFRQSTGQLSIEVPLIVSNHPDFATLAATYNIPFHHLPVTAETKSQQESQILELASQHNIDLIVLARYMQVLSPKLCEAMSGRIINIHHSFLPSFKGAKPYHQAYDRGVKIIGATAHFVTSDLDEGPIIEQNVVRVNHSMSPKELTHAGSNVESNVLATAVKYFAERRVILNGHKTVVFD